MIEKSANGNFSENRNNKYKDRLQRGSPAT